MSFCYPQFSIPPVITTNQAKYNVIADIQPSAYEKNSEKYHQKIFNAKFLRSNLTFVLSRWGNVCRACGDVADCSVERLPHLLRIFAVIFCDSGLFILPFTSFSKAWSLCGKKLY